MSYLNNSARIKIAQKHAKGLKLFNWECEKLIFHVGNSSAACVGVTELCNEMCELDTNRRAHTLTHIHEIGESGTGGKSFRKKASLLSKKQ